MSAAAGEAATVRLGEAVVGEGIGSVNFFNGRLLSAEDLRGEQLGQRRARMRLGRAIGTGVAEGLEVAEAAGLSETLRPVLAVEAGIALTPRGTALELPTAVNVSLLREPAKGSAAPALFADCEPLAAGPQVAGAGAYVLTIAAAERDRGRAEARGLRGGAAACDVDQRVEGVRFRLIRLPLSHRELADTRLRNLLAHRAYGTEDPARASFGADPFGPPARCYGLLDELRRDCLGEDEVPLATIEWTLKEGLRFVDLWSVRRRPAGGAVPRWAPLVGERPRSEAEARLQQFQDEVEGLRLRGSGSLEMRAAERFAYLPPAGILPVRGKGSPRGFDPEAFFAGLGAEEGTAIAGSSVPRLIHESLFEEAIAVPQEGREPEDGVRLHAVLDNERALEAGTARQRVLVFARRSLWPRR